MALIRQMTPRDAVRVLRFWNATPGMRTTDTPALIRQFLRRNPGGSFVAMADGRMLGAVLGGHDGRRGTLWHLAVKPGQRRLGLGAKLTARALAVLRAQGIRRVNILVLNANTGGMRFWKRQGWKRIPVSILSRDV